VTRHDEVCDLQDPASGVAELLGVLGILILYG
jgi:hypothetical protein